MAKTEIERLATVETKIDLLITDMSLVKGDLKSSNADMKTFIHHEINAQKENILKAESLMDRRLEGMNEVREQLAAQGKTFITKDTYESSIGSLAEKVDELRVWKENQVGGKSGVTDFKSWITWIILIAGFVMTYFVLRGGT
jgi:hypothetical protein